MSLRLTQGDENLRWFSTVPQLLENIAGLEPLKADFPAIFEFSHTPFRPSRRRVSRSRQMLDAGCRAMDDVGLGKEKKALRHDRRPGEKMLQIPARKQANTR